MSNIIDFEVFLRIPSFFYRSVGIDLWNTDGGPLQNAVFYFAFINLNIWLCSELLFAVLMVSKNFIQATMTLSYAGFVLVGTIKIYYMWRKKAEMTRFLQLMNTIFPRTEPQQKIMNLRSRLRQCTIVMSAFVMTFMILIWTYNLYPYMQRQIYDCWLQVRSVNQALPYESYIPWNWHGHWSFYLLYALQSIGGYHSAAGQIASDLLICAMATQLIMHYEYVAQKFTEYQPQVGADRGAKGELTVGKGSSASSFAAMGSVAYSNDMKFLRDIIAYHANVLSLSDIMNEVLGVPLFVNFMTSTFVICFVGFQLTIDAEPDYMVKLLLFFLSSLTQICLICHYGQLLIDASQNVGRAVYNHYCIHSHVHYQRMLVLVAARAQKPAMLKATSFVLISRGTITDIIQISYKFFTLVRTMYSN